MAVGKWTQRRPREVQRESSKGSPSRERLAWGHLARLPDQESILGRGGVILKLVLFVTQPRPPAIPIPPKRDGGGIAADGSQGTYLSQTALGRGEAGDPRASSQVNLSASSLPSAGPNLPGSLPALHSSATPPRGWSLCSKGCCFPSWPF